MRLFRTAVFIIGFFLPLVIQAQPFGETELSVFDTDFLPAPPGPAWEIPLEPPVPHWVEMVSEPEPLPGTLPVISFTEIM